MLFSRCEFCNQNVAGKNNNCGDEAENPENIGSALEIIADQSQWIFTAAGGDGNDNKQGDDNTHETFADNQAGGKEHATVTAGIYIFVFMSRTALGGSGFEIFMNDVAHDRTDNQGNFQGWRQIDAHPYGQRRQGKCFCVLREKQIDNNCDNAYADTQKNIVPVKAGTEYTLGDRGHQGSLRSCQGMRRIHAGTGQRPGEAVSLIQQIQDRRDGKSADYGT